MANVINRIFLYKENHTEQQQLTEKEKKRLKHCTIIKVSCFCRFYSSSCGKGTKNNNKKLNVEAKAKNIFHWQHATG